MPHAQSTQRWFRLLMRIAVATLIIIVVAGIVIWHQSWRAPTWYNPPADTAAVRDFAGQVENRLVEEAHRIRPPAETWTVRLREEQINAWLATRLPQWIAHEPDIDWPEELGTPQVHITEAGIDIAVDVQLTPGSSARFLVARLQPRVDDTGIAFDLEQVGAGRLRLPGSTVGAALEQFTRRETSDVIGGSITNLLDDVASGRGVADRDIELADDRIVRVIDLKCDDGSLRVTFQTLPPGSRDTPERDTSPDSPRRNDR